MSKLARKLGGDAKYVINAAQEEVLLELENTAMSLTVREVRTGLWHAHIQHSECELTLDGEIETGLAAHGATEIEALLALLVCCYAEHAYGYKQANPLDERFTVIEDRLCDLLGCREPGHAGHLCPNGWSVDTMQASGTIERRSYCHDSNIWTETLRSAG